MEITRRGFLTALSVAVLPIRFKFEEAPLMDTQQFTGRTSAFQIIDAVVNYGLAVDKTAAQNTAVFELIKAEVGNRQTVVFVQAGTYAVDPALTFPANVELIGNGVILSGVSTVPIAPVSFQNGAFIFAEDFGAIGDGVHDDTAAIQAAIDSLSERGGTVYLRAKEYIITSTLTIGNGSDVAHSAKMGVRLIGEGTNRALGGSQYFSPFVHTGTRLFWKGVAGGTMLQVLGPIYGVSVSGVCFDGNRDSTYRAGRLIDLISCNQGTFNKISGYNFSDIGLYLHTREVATISGDGNGIVCGSNLFEQIQMFQVDTAATCIRLDGWRDNTGHDSTQNIFRRISYGYHKNGGIGVYLGFSDFNRFENIVGVAYGAGVGGYGVYLDGAGAMPFPCPDNNVFDHCAIGVDMGYAGTPGDNFFYNYSTDDGAIIPSGAIETYAHGVSLPSRTPFGKLKTPRFDTIQTVQPYAVKSAQGFAVANGAEYSLGAAYGVLIAVRDSSSGHSCLAFVTNTAVAIVSDPSAGYSTVKGTATKRNLYYQGGAIILENQTGALHNFNVVGLQLG